VRAVKARGAALKATEQPIDTCTASGKCFLDMLGVFAEFETNLRKERQLEGIANAKECGVYKGRKASRDIRTPPEGENFRREACFSLRGSSRVDLNQPTNDTGRNAAWTGWGSQAQLVPKSSSGARRTFSATVAG